MRKPKANSVIDGLPANQKETLERWFFEENISFADAVKRLYQDFGVRSSESALRRYWQRRSQRRALDQIAMTAATVNQAEQEFTKNPAETSRVLLGLVQQIALRSALKGDEQIEIKTLADLTSLVLTHEQVLIKRQAEERKQEELKLLAQKLDLELKRYQDTVAERKRNIEAALKTGSKVGSITREAIQLIQEECKLL